MIEGSKKNIVKLSLPVDLIRALAITLVILLHAGASFEVSFQNPFPWCGVPLFVMLSGTLLLDPSKIAEPLGVFFRKRLSRIALPFLFWGMIYFAWRSFANSEALTFDSIWRGFLGAGQYPYYHFWFVYMLIGLYLVTPILRVVFAHASSKILGYFILLWFVGTGIVPLLGGFASVWLDSQLFIIPMWMGYFVLGAYMQTMRLSSKVFYTILFSGFLWASFYGWLVTVTGGGTGQLLATNTILASGVLFLVLCVAPTKSLERRFPRTYGLLVRVGQNSFGIYLLHVIVLEVLGERGLFGFNLSIMSLNPILGIPLLSLFTLIVTFGIIWLLRKVPMLNKAIG